MRLAVIVVLLLLPGVSWAEEKTPSYMKDVRPILQNHCARCHQGKRAKAGVDVTSIESLLRGGRRGKKVLMPGKPGNSPLVTTMEGKKPVMPPRKERKRPTTEEIAIIRKWIAEGAKDDSKKE